MRPLELAGFVFAILPALALAGVISRRAGIAAAIISCAILLAAAVWLGPYWQVLPLYLAAVAGLAALFRRARRRSMRLALATAVACLLSTTAAFTYVLPMFQLPPPTGPYRVGTSTLDLIDPSRIETHVSGPARPREIVVQLWYPASPDGQRRASYRSRRETTWLSSYMGELWTHSYRDAPVAASGGPFPVLLFNPAWGGQRTQNTYQTEDLASHGFIVAAIDHPYNSGPVAFSDGRVLEVGGLHDISDFRHTTLDQQMAIGDREARIQAGDDILALDDLAAADLNPRSPWFHRVDANDAGAFGHSFGGAAAAETCYEDPRVKAALNEDGWMFGDVATLGLDKPYMMITDDLPEVTPGASADLQTRRVHAMNVRDEKSLDESLRRFGGYFVTIHGVTHNNFRDRALYSPVRRLNEAGTIAPARAHAIVEAYTLQFFSYYLLHKPAPLLTATSQPFWEVKLEKYSPQAPLTP